MTEIDMSTGMDNFDLSSHFDTTLDNMFGHGEYGAYELQILKTLAAFGESLAAEFLASAYETGEFHENLEPQPKEELFWVLVERFLRGKQDWADYTKLHSSIDENDKDVIIEDVCCWINDHPIAHQIVISKWYRDHGAGSDGNVPPSELALGFYYQP